MFTKGILTEQGVGSSLFKRREMLKSLVGNQFQEKFHCFVGYHSTRH
uniref:Protoheme IX farnesyltransferase n=1 Tax=Phakopsora pachyrhizi TaxID=170000 RepID=A0A0S1MJA1_PHAPC